MGCLGMRISNMALMLRRTAILMMLTRSTIILFPELIGIFRITMSRVQSEPMYGEIRIYIHLYVYMFVLGTYSPYEVMLTLLMRSSARLKCCAKPAELYNDEFHLQ